MKSFVTLVIISLCLGCVSTIHGQIDRISYSNFPTSTVTDSLYIIYDSDHSDEELFLIQSIQGIVAKENR